MSHSRDHDRATGRPCARRARLPRTHTTWDGVEALEARLLLSAAGQVDIAEYLPMGAGAVWEYDASPGRQSGKFEVSHVRDRDGRDVATIDSYMWEEWEFEGEEDAYWSYQGNEQYSAGPEGWHLYEQEMPIGWKDINVWFTPPLQLAPGTVAVGGAYDASSAVEATYRGYDATGTAEVTTRIVGWQTVKVPSGTYSALKLDLDLTAQMHFTDLGTIKSTEDMTVYLAPGLGIVKEVQKASLSGNIEGYGRLRDAMRQTFVLTGYEGVPAPAPYVDLVPAFAAVDLPHTVVAGVETRGKVSLTVENAGTMQTARGLLEDLRCVLVPVDAGAAPPVQPLHDPLPVKVGSLAPRRGQKARATLTVPAGVPVGTYRLEASLGASHDPEHDDNNRIVYESLLQVLPPSRNIVGAWSSPKVPERIVAGTSANVTLPLLIDNHGNVPTAAHRTLDVLVVARPVAGGADVPVARSEDLRFGNMLERARRLNLRGPLPPALEPGSYALYAHVDALDEVAETNEVDNWIAGPSFTVEPARVDVDVQARAGAARVRIGSKVGVRLQVVNSGNVPSRGELGATVRFEQNGQAVDVEVAPRKFNVKQARSSNLSLNVEVPADLDPGACDISVELHYAPAEGTPLDHVPANDIIDLGTLTLPAPRGTSSPGVVDPDLVLLGADVPRKIDAFEWDFIADAVKNRGRGPAGASTLAYYLSLNRKLDGLDTLLATREIDPLLPGGVDTGRTDMPFISPVVGLPMYLLVVVDDGNRVSETRSGEKNNVKPVRVTFI